MQDQSPQLHTFENVVPFSDETVMVLKAQLFIEKCLWSLIRTRIDDHEMLNEMAGQYSPVSSGMGLVYLAKALLMRDELAPVGTAKLWPAFKTLNNLRNLVAHNLHPDQMALQKAMRKFIQQATGEPPANDENLAQSFWQAAYFLTELMNIDQRPMTFAEHAE